MNQISPKTLEQLRNRLGDKMSFDSLLLLYGEKHPDVLAEIPKWAGYPWDKDALWESMSRNGMLHAKTETEPGKDNRLLEAVDELLCALAARTDRPVVLRIGGVPLLVEEFVMPILGRLVEISGKKLPGFDEEPELALHTKRVAVKADLKGDEANSDQSLVWRSVQDNVIQIALASSKNLRQKGTQYYKYNYEDGKIKPSPSTKPTALITLEGKKNKAALCALDVGKFSYNLYMRDTIFKPDTGSGKIPWWLGIPLLSPQHCPTGRDSLSVIAQDMGMQVAHEGMDISTALRALSEPECPYAMILPSYLTALSAIGIKSVDFNEITPNPNWDDYSEIKSGIEEFKNHSVSLVWKSTAIRDYLVRNTREYSKKSSSKHCSDRGSDLLNEIAKYIEKRLNQPGI